MKGYVKVSVVKGEGRRWIPAGAGMGEGEARGARPCDRLRVSGKGRTLTSILSQDGDL